MTAAGEKTRGDLGWNVLCEGWAARAHTERGAQRIRKRGSELDLDRDEASLQLQRIVEARSLRADESPLVFGGISDILLALARAEKGASLAPEDLIAVARTAAGCDALAETIGKRAVEVPRLTEIAEEMLPMAHLHQQILGSFDDDGTLSDSASASLGRLRKRVASLVSALEEKAGTLLDDSRLHAHLQDRFYTQRGDRYVIPVKVESRGQVKGIVHGTSGSGQTVFVEPAALVELGNKLRLAECDVSDEERRIYAELTSAVAAETTTLRVAVDAATELDLIDAAGLLADTLGANVAEIDGDDGQRVDLRSALHPLMVLAGKPCIANDIAVDRGSGLVISGPNAGGKTVALKTVGLAALMVRAGLPVAAESGSVVPWFDVVASDIGDSQSLEMDLSTFSARILRLGEFLDEAGYGALILVDEIAVGTEPEQGAALAQAVLETLVEHGATVIATTHYESLKMLAGSDSRFVNASVGFNMEKLEPTFRLTIGIPGASGALRVARRLGLKEDVLTRAEALRGDARATVDALIESLEVARAELEDERTEVAQMREQVADAKWAAARAEERAKELEKRAREGAHSDATAALKEARRELESARVKVRKKADTGALKSIAKEIDTAAKAIGKNAPAKPSVGRQATVADLKVGAPVYVTTLGAHGKVLSEPRSGKVEVVVGSLRASVAVTKIRIEPGRTAPKSKAPRSSNSGKASGKTGAAVRTETKGAALVRTPEATLDLRGQRADEAVDELDRFLDRSLLASRSALVIIHGHGTGALRTAVRGHLATHPAVLEWRPGELREGGDGVTVAALDA